MSDHPFDGARAARVIRRLYEIVRFPPPYDGPILSGRIDGLAYLLGWTATFAHLTL